MGVLIAAAADVVVAAAAAAHEQLVAIAVIAAAVLARNFAGAAPAAVSPPMGSVPDRHWQPRSDHDPAR